MFTKLSSQIVDKMIDMYNSGITQNEIAESYKVTQALVSYHFIKRGIIMRKNKFTKEAKIKATQMHVRGSQHPEFRDLPMKKIAAEYKSGASANSICSKYDVSNMTILRKLKAFGIVLRKEGFSGWHTTIDGHRVQSNLELTVDNWLYNHGISHIPQPMLPFGNKNTRADFLVRDTYLEILGLTSEKYKLRYEKKLEMYIEHELKVLYIFPKDIKNGLKILEPFL